MELRQILARVDELKAQIDALRPIKPEHEQRILQKFRLDWNYHSNAIEGNSLTLGETRAFLLEGLTAKGKPFKDHLDIRGHNQLILFLEEFVRRKEVLTEAAIREMHKILLVEPYQVEARTPDGQATKKWVKLGEYKTEPNAVQTTTGEWIYYARPEDTAPRMAELVAWYRQQVETRAEHPLLVATLFHHRFTHIHPFEDGNGRMARALMNVILMREGFPPVVIKNEQRVEYVGALRRADAGDTSDLTTLVGDGVLRAQELFVRGAKGVELQELDDLNKEITLLKQQLREVEEPIRLTGESQQRVVRHALRPLLQHLLPKLRQFDELFLAARKRIVVTENPNHAGKTSPFEMVDDVLRFIEEETRGKLLCDVRVFFEWEKFQKGGLNVFDHSERLDVHFREHKYVLAVPGFPPREYLYQQQITSEEIQRLVTDITSRVIKTVKAGAKLT